MVGPYLAPVPRAECAMAQAEHVPRHACPWQALGCDALHVLDHHAFDAVAVGNARRLAEKAAVPPLHGERIVIRSTPDHDAIDMAELHGNVACLGDAAVDDEGEPWKV